MSKLTIMERDDKIMNNNSDNNQEKSFPIHSAHNRLESRQFQMQRSLPHIDGDNLRPKLTTISVKNSRITSDAAKSNKTMTGNKSMGAGPNQQQQQLSLTVPYRKYFKMSQAELRHTAAFKKHTNAHLESVDRFKLVSENVSRYCFVLLCIVLIWGPNQVSGKLTPNSPNGESSDVPGSALMQLNGSTSTTIRPGNVAEPNSASEVVQHSGVNSGSDGAPIEAPTGPLVGHRLHQRLRHHKGKKFRQHQQNTINYLMSVILDSSATNKKTSGHTGLETASSNSRQRFFLTSMLSRIMNVMNVTEFAFEVRDGISSRASCVFCNAVAGLFLSPLYSKDVFSAAIKAVCTSFRLFTPRVCNGFVDSFQDDFEYIRKNTRLARDEVCAVIFGTDCARRVTHNLNWTIPIPGLPRSNNQQPGDKDHGDEQSHTQQSGDKAPANKIASEQHGVGGQKQDSLTGATARPNALGLLDDEIEPPDLLEYRKSAGGTSAAPLLISGETQAAASDQPLTGRGATLTGPYSGGMLADNEPGKITNFVQITDIHVDPYYEPGTSADCREPLCCRITSGPPQGRRAAGSWGDYGNCDTPIATLRHAFNRIRQHHKDAEYWLWTGDIAPHDIWNVTKSEVIHQIRLISGMVKEYSRVPVFPVVGNHEAVPVNSFSPPEIRGKFSMSWLYDVLADEWGYWLPEDAKATLRIGGYYRVKVRRGFRIISLNTNYCARLNPWSLFNPIDPGDQLKWLSQQLLEAEQASDKVHIIGHVPPDNRECMQAWLFNFIRLVDRFKDTILAQFYGHTHRDEFRVIYSLRSEAPVGVAYIGPSVTPFTENNPAYRVYHQDQTGHLVDAQTYFFNLTEANLSDDGPVWRHEYRLSSSLNMTSMRPKDWHTYIQRMHEDENMFDEFHRHFYRSSDLKKDKVCRAKCKYHMLNDLRVAHPFKTKPKPLLANRKNSNHNHHGR